MADVDLYLAVAEAIRNKPIETVRLEDFLIVMPFVRDNFWFRLEYIKKYGSTIAFVDSAELLRREPAERQQYLEKNLTSQCDCQPLLQELLNLIAKHSDGH